MKIKVAKSPVAAGAFTLIELLTVIAIIGILAGMLLLALARVKQSAKVTAARVDMANVGTAITQYHSDYSSLPASTNAAFKAAQLNEDFTFGTFVHGTGGGSPFENQSVVNPSVVNPNIVTPGSSYQNDNSEVIAILTDAAFYPNTGHLYSSKSLPEYTGRPGADTNSPGIDPYHTLRDPWGLPYIITLDLNYDNKCVDPIWSLTPVIGNTNFSVPGEAMIWSFGPLKTISLTQGPTSMINKSIVKSWK